MELDKIINSVVRDMRMSGLISEESTGEVRMFIQMACIAGWEERGKELAHSRWDCDDYKIQKFTRDGILVNEYSSPSEAVRKDTTAKRTTIWKALKTGRPTSRGYIWRYAGNGTH